MKIRASELDRHITGNYGEDQFVDFTGHVDGETSYDLLDDCWRAYIQASNDNDPNVEAIHRTYSIVLENFIRTLERVEART